MGEFDGRVVLDERFHDSNHIREPQLVCRTKYG
jgi:hypothetical protein